MKKVITQTCLMLIVVFAACSNKSVKHTQQNITATTDSIAVKNEALQKIYTQAIGNYIQFVSKECKLTFDTLFFGKHVYAQPDDFPDIELPAVIEHTNIKLITPEQGTKNQMEHKSSFYINLIGWVDADNADFTFVTFSNGFAHQFDCFIKYKYDTTKKAFVLEATRFENYLYKAK